MTSLNAAMSDQPKPGLALILIKQIGQGEWNVLLTGQAAADGCEHLVPWNWL